MKRYFAYLIFFVLFLSVVSSSSAQTQTQKQEVPPLSVQNVRRNIQPGSPSRPSFVEVIYLDLIEKK